MKNCTVNSCYIPVLLIYTCQETVSVGITIKNYYLENFISTFETDTETSCISRCFENHHCLSIAYKSSNCYFYSGEASQKHPLSKVKKSKIIIFPTKINDEKDVFVVEDLRFLTKARPTSNNTIVVESCKSKYFCSDKNNCKNESDNTSRHDILC